MNSQNNEDSINFSVIDKPPDAQPNLDFSLPELLEPENQHTSSRQQQPPSLQKSIQCVFSRIKKGKLGNSRSVVKEDKQQNTFLEALERMEKELSFQTESYNIYEQNPNFQTQVIHNNKSKTLSCLKTTKETNKSTTANEQTASFNDYFGPLIIDFKKKDQRAETEKNKPDLKSKKHHKAQPLNKSNSKSGSQLSSELSQPPIKVKQRRNTKSKSKEDLKSVLGLREKSKSSRNYLLPPDFRKSKTKCNLGKRSVSKSHSNLKISSQADTYASKVFTEYYGTDTNFKGAVGECKQKKQPGFTITQIKSREKSKSKSKLGILSPRGKVSHVAGRK